MADEEIVPEPDPIQAEVLELTVENVPLAPDNRPAQNVLGEIKRTQREFETKIQRQLADIAAMLQQRPAAPAPITPTPGSEYTTEQLAQLSAAGNAEATRILIQRGVQEESEKKFAAWTQQQQVQGALSQILARHPVLTDASHPLTQAVYQARQTFLQNGWAPGPATDLEAIKATFLQSPHLVPQPTSAAQASDAARRAAVTPQQAMDGAAPRRSPQQTRPQGAPMDKKLMDIAKRMDVKDPAGSLKRFQERQNQNRSLVSPAVQQAVREENA